MDMSCGQMFRDRGDISIDMYLRQTISAPLSKWRGVRGEEKILKHKKND
jgi:hypothetical protein